jgi:hypothetical protein
MDFKQALANTLTDQDVDIFLKKPDCSPRFVYGALMLPNILKYYIDLDQGVKIQKFMTQATLSGYQLHQYAEEGIPIIVESDNSNTAVQGMLVFNLNSEQRNAIHELESGLLRLASVQVEICQKSQHDGRHTMRKIDAGIFEWNPSWCSGTESPNTGLQLMRGSMWDVEPFIRSSLYQNMVKSQRRTALAMDGSYATSGNTSNSLVEIYQPPKEDSEEYFTPVEDD